MKTFLLCCVFLASFATATGSSAQLRLMVASDPSHEDSFSKVAALGYGDSLGKQLGKSVQMVPTAHLTDVMRATRAREFDVFVGPSQVAASALEHGYRLIGNTGRDEIYVLVVHSSITSLADLKGKKIYLPQQDSIYSYLGRGMLNEAGFSLKNFSEVMFRQTSGAGLIAVSAGIARATVAKRSDYDDWTKQQVNHASHVLIESKPVPGGVTLVAKDELAPELLQKVAVWGNNVLKAQQRSGREPYRYVSQLGIFTPTALPGANRVGAQEVETLIKSGVTCVDVRTEREYKARRVPGAIHIAYNEKSPKDIAFDEAQDSFVLPDNLDRGKPIVFYCNGPECWKSYKASKAAVKRGFKEVHWFRGGMPEWDKTGLAALSN